MKTVTKNKYKYFVITKIGDGIEERFCVKDGIWKSWIANGTEFARHETAEAIIAEFQLTKVKICEMNKVIYNIKN
jgi:hypothetical protein